MNPLKILLSKLVPQSQTGFIGPRFEPNNLSGSATAQTIITAIRAAEVGETRELFSLYRDALLNDDHIQGEWNKRKLAVLGQPISFLPADKTNLDDQIAASVCCQAREDCENFLEGLNALDGSTLWPVSIIENLFRPADRPARLADGTLIPFQYTLKRFEEINPQLFCYRHAYLVGGVGLGTATPVQTAGLDKNPGTIGTSDWYQINLEDWEPYVRLWPTDSAGRIIYDTTHAVKLDPLRHIVHRAHLLPMHMRDNWGGPFRAVLAWWLLRGLGRDWFGRFMERYGMPFPVGKVNINDEKAIAFLRDAFSLAVKIGGMVIGQGDEVELKEAAVQGGAEGHAKWHDVCNRAISRVIVGMDLSASAAPTGLGSGVADLQGNVREDIRMMDSVKLVQTLETQLCRHILAVNGLRGRVRVQLGGLSDSDAVRFADLLGKLKIAGFEPQDGELEKIGDKVGMAVQRAAAPAPGMSMFSAAHLSSLADPVDSIAAASAPQLGRELKAFHAPVRELIKASKTPQEAMDSIRHYYTHVLPTKPAESIERALQTAAAAGAKK